MRHQHQRQQLAAAAWRGGGGIIIIMAAASKRRAVALQHHHHLWHGENIGSESARRSGVIGAWRRHHGRRVKRAGAGGGWRKALQRTSGFIKQPAATIYLWHDQKKKKKKKLLYGVASTAIKALAAQHGISSGKTTTSA